MAASMLSGDETVSDLLRLCRISSGKAAAAAKALNAWIWSEDAGDRNDVPDLREVLDALKSPHFVAELRGFKFLSNFMAVFPDKIASMHYGVLLVMQEIPSERHTSYYGKMYVRAWDMCKEDGRKAIKAAIVDLAKRAPGLSRDNEHYILGMLNVRLFILLEYFFGKGAHSAEVAQMMTDIFEDNIWPHLQSRSAIWRSNAADALFMAYPLERPNLSQFEKEALFEKQHRAMLSLLEDRSQLVRFVAVRGVCDMLAKANYWRLVSDRLRSTMLKRLRDRAFDGDPRVRQQVLSNLRKIVPLLEAANALETLLEGISDSFHDVVAAVRMEFVELLHAIKRQGHFPFHRAVPLNSLVAGLRAEKVEANVKALVKLILPFFCPLEEPMSTISGRIKSLSRLNREGMWKLFSNSKGVLLFEEAVKLIDCALTFISDSLQVSSSQRSSGPGQRRKTAKKQSRAAKALAPTTSAEAGAMAQSAQPVQPAQPEEVTALLQVICIVWKAHQNELAADADGNDLLLGLSHTLEQKMPTICDALKKSQSMPKEAKEAFECLCILCKWNSDGVDSALLADAKEAVVTATEASAQQVLAQHGFVIMKQDAPGLLATLSNAVVSSLGPSARRSQLRGRHFYQGQDSDSPPRCTSRGWHQSPSPEAALVLLEVIFLHSPLLCSQLLHEHFDAVADMMDQLSRVTTLLVGHSPVRHRPSDKVFQHCLHLYTSMMVPLAEATPPDREPETRARRCVSTCIDLLEWAERRVVPALASLRTPQAEGESQPGTSAAASPVHFLRETLATLTAVVGSRKLYDQQLLTSAFEFCHLLVHSAEYFPELIGPIVQLLCSALWAFDTGEANLLLIKDHVCPLVGHLLAALPAQVNASEPCRLSMDDFVVLTASATVRVLDCLETCFKDESEELEGALISDVASSLMNILWKEIQKRGNTHPSIKDISDNLPVSSYYLLAPLRESLCRIHLLVEVILKWHSTNDVSKTIAATAVLLTVLKSEPHGKQCEKLIEETLIKITVDENFNTYK